MGAQSYAKFAFRALVAAGAVYSIARSLQRAELRIAHAGLAAGKRFLVLGGGFAGASVAQELLRLLPGDGNGEIVVVDADNFLLFTPMLTEAAGGELEPRDIVSPTRSMDPRIRFVQGRITAIDLVGKKIDVQTGTANLDPATQTFQGDHLVIALGSVVSFHETPGAAEHSFPLKRLEDAAHVFRHVSACLERAASEPDAGKRQELLTFVVGGGGYTGIEAMAAINDLVRSGAGQLSSIDAGAIRTIVVHPGERILPEITPDLAAYASDKLTERGVEIKLKTKIEAAGKDFVQFGGERLSTRTLIWAAGVMPNPLVNDLPAAKGQHHGLAVNGYCQVAGWENVWALGDCAEIPKPDGKGTYAPTAQNATREGNLVAQNIVRTLRGEALKEFRFEPLGELALVGRHSGVARVYGRNFSGLLAWAMWRAVYLAKMPSMGQRSRILTDWLLDAAFGRGVMPISSGSQVRVGQ